MLNSKVQCFVTHFPWAYQRHFFISLVCESVNQWWRCFSVMLYCPSTQYWRSVSAEWQVVARGHGPRDVRLLSQINATFSVGLCAEDKRSASCVETHTLQVVRMQEIPTSCTWLFTLKDWEVLHVEIKNNWYSSSKTSSSKLKPFVFTNLTL